MANAAGNYIYSGIAPLLKMAITIACGFVLARKGMFPQAAARGASYVAMATTWSNWGNLPIAVITTIATQEPFDKSVDPTLGTAYVAVFTLIYNVTFFGMGGCKVCAWDFRPGATEVTPMRKRWFERRQTVSLWVNSLRSHQIKSVPHHSSPAERDLSLAKSNLQHSPILIPDPEAVLVLQNGNSNGSVIRPSASTPSNQTVSFPQICRYRSHQEVVHTVQSLPDTIQLAPVSSSSSRNRAVIPGREYDVPEDAVPKLRYLGEAIERKGNSSGPVSLLQQQKLSTIPRSDALHVDSTEANMIKGRSVWYSTPINIVKLMLTPPSISLFLALPISLVQPLKALFVHVEGWTGGRMPNGPDGKPPLSWLLDTANFLGQICIPLGLILLGSSFARLKLPKPPSKLPISAIVIYSPDGAADTLSAFLALQYAFMFISSAALAAIALAIVA
ncbi:hypothetical protein QFC21_002086 [Naganishia friedmannii]|uniref:Uncharacterized protein n=1 Tax=Naganishia friedmannii TaxID=89922 RepID=A0ACC2VYX2_9TREE|nr:hypothetical protein QFC21_002086 [Naganishia friedmannii]